MAKQGIATLHSYQTARAGAILLCRLANDPQRARNFRRRQTESAVRRDNERVIFLFCATVPAMVYFLWRMFSPIR